jgi:hypothetical protein
MSNQQSPTQQSTEQPPQEQKKPWEMPPEAPDAKAEREKFETEFIELAKKYEATLKEMSEAEDLVDESEVGTFNILSRSFQDLETKDDTDKKKIMGHFQNKQRYAGKVLKAFKQLKKINELQTNKQGQMIQALLARIQELEKYIKSTEEGGDAVSSSTS